MQSFKSHLRMVICFTFVLALFVVGIARIYVIDKSEIAKTADQAHIYTLNLGRLRGNIFDTNGISLTSPKSVMYSVFAPTAETIFYASSVLEGEEKERVVATLKNGKPAAVQTKSPISCAGVINVEVPIFNRDDGILAHLLGYVDSSYRGVSGLNKVFDNILYTDSNVSVRYSVGGNGNILSGIEGRTESIDSITLSGIKTTIDYNIQLATEHAAEKIKTGAVIVSEIENGKVRAMVSRPTFEPANVAEYLNGENSPLLNRCLNSFNVGSAFKPVVAAAAIENGLGWFVNDCTGSFTTEGNIFYCHNKAGHGSLGLGGAIAKSCNTYFYRFSHILGAQKIYNTATLFGFGYNKTLYNGFSTSGENITDITVLESSKSALSNLSIGQGELMASPVTLLNLYSAIAGGGVYYAPVIVESVVSQGVDIKFFERSNPTRAISADTASKLKQYLINTVENGTGKAAKPTLTSAGGKTATAQTGIKLAAGNFAEHSWFCGFFPADKPKYCAVVLIENNDSSVSATEVFSLLADNIISLNID